jgi:hypothetical protein
MVIPLYPMRVPEPAGSIQSNARDMARWLLFHLADGCLGKRRLVSTTALGETHTPQMVVRMSELERETFPDTTQMSYGMGWVIQDHRGHLLLSHAGAIDGFRCHLTLVPAKNLGIAILSNLHQTRLNLALSDSLLDLLLDLPRSDWNARLLRVVRKDAAAAEERERQRLSHRHHGTHPSRELSAYTGRYQHPAYGTVRVTLEQGTLVWRWNDFNAALDHFHYDTYTLPIEIMGYPQVVFRLDADGSVKWMKVLGNMGVEFRRTS